jgi:hypothetical protein
LINLFGVIKNRSAKPFGLPRFAGDFGSREWMPQTWNFSPSRPLLGMSSKKTTKYRPGIDSPPPSRGARLLSLLGLTATVALVATLFKRLARRQA